MINDARIALVGAGGMAFGPVMTYDTMCAKEMRGSTLVLVDINEARLEIVRAAAEQLNRAMGNPVKIEAESHTARGIDGADFVILSVEKARWKCWQQDYEIPRKYGSTQVMGENGGPGGMFHSLRSIKLVLEICELVEKYSPDAFVVNLTNPMSRVTLAINRATDLRNVGLCHEFVGGMLRLSLYLMLHPSKIEAAASGINHFTWFYKIKHAETGEDLYPKLQHHMRRFPFLHPPLVKHCMKEFGLYPTSTDSHIGEYLPFVSDVVKPMFPFHKFFENEGKLREHLIKLYGKGFLPIPAKILPESGEEALPICQALATESETSFNAVNVPNKGYIPNLPDGAIVEVPAHSSGGELHPDTVPPIKAELAEYILPQLEIQDRVVEAAINRDPGPAFEALVMDPLSPPDESSCRRMFDEMLELQRDLLPFD